jgi:hypothetical protein
MPLIKESQMMKMAAFDRKSREGKSEISFENLTVS